MILLSFPLAWTDMCHGRHQQWIRRMQAIHGWNSLLVNMLLSLSSRIYVTPLPRCTSEEEATKLRRESQRLDTT